MMPPVSSGWRLCATCLLACQLLTAAVAIDFSPCDEITAIKRTEAFSIGLVYWPGGLETDWGSPETGLQPCDPAVQANLTALGAMFATYQVRADRLTALKTSFLEELMLTSKAPAGSPKVISVVAFRNNVRSEARYIASFEPSVTAGTGFVPSLALLAKFELGNLRYLQFFNLTCNDCGGRTSAQCINSTSCALAPSVCTCPSSSSSGGSPTSRHLLQDNGSTGSNDTTGNSTADSNSATNGTDVQLGMNATGGTPSCNYANFSFCATGINLAFEGVDANSAAFTTASQVKKLTSYSLVSIYFKAKEAFLETRDKFTSTAGEYWGNFGAVQDNIQQAYSGNQAASVDALSG
uniref:Pherophorin domain-containing protein n=1 Tax=Tetradesmus obliquus TaxID=3088 RepID=A0A383W183_TETOB|eukprot:jgi/Sobl393_1/4951/SZX70852.1